VAIKIAFEAGTYRRAWPTLRRFSPRTFQGAGSECQRLHRYGRRTASRSAGRTAC